MHEPNDIPYEKLVAENRTFFVDRNARIYTIDELVYLSPIELAGIANKTAKEIMGNNKYWFKYDPVKKHYIPMLVYGNGTSKAKQDDPSKIMILNSNVDAKLTEVRASGKRLRLQQNYDQAIKRWIGLNAYSKLDNGMTLREYAMKLGYYVTYDNEIRYAPSQCKSFLKAQTRIMKLDNVYGVNGELLLRGIHYVVSGLMSVIFPYNNNYGDVLFSKSLGYTRVKLFRSMLNALTILELHKIKYKDSKAWKQFVDGYSNYKEKHLSKETQYIKDIIKQIEEKAKL